MIHSNIYLKNQHNQLYCAIWFGSLVIPLVIVCEFLPSKILIHLILLFAGWLTWTYTEYWLHRFYMHAPGKYNKAGNRHMHHHQHPTELKITLWQRVIISVIVLLFYIVSWMLNNYFTFIAGFATGIFGYTLMHWVLHQSWSQRIFPQQVLFHMHHHCKHSDKCFGISIPWWDYLFGTIPPANTVISQKVTDFYFKQ